MSTTTPNSISRYRPAVLVLAGLAAAFAGYQIYSITQASDEAGLHRSNAVRRPNARRRRRASGAATIRARLDRVATVGLGTFEFEGTQFPLSPSSLLPPVELAQAIQDARPGIAPDDLNDTMNDVYAAFCDRLVEFASPSRGMTEAEAEALVAWVGDNLPNNISSALEIHAAERPRANAIISPDRNRNESPAPTELSWGSDEGSDNDAGDPEDQTLQRTLYHIAEDRARQEGVVHRGITCNSCDGKPIRGIRWHCANCADYDLCANCEATNSHTKTHIFYKIRVPAPYLSMPKQEPLYPGKPHAMPASADPELKKRLIKETRMEAEEIDALWDQFTCLAGTEWLDDPNKVGWALNRRAFNHTFIPRYNSFVAAPNLVYDRIFAYYDTDKNGLIGFEEWIKGLDGMHASSGPKKSKMMFRGYDVDGDGHISRKDVLRIFRAYYAIEKEATRNFVAEITEEVSVRNSLDIIRSSQPLGSAFPPHDLSSYSVNSQQLQEKLANGVKNDALPLQENNEDVASRPDMLRLTDTRNLPNGVLSQPQQDRIVSDRWARRQYYVDEEEGLSGDDATLPTDEHNHGNSISPELLVSWGGFEIPAPEKDLGKEVMYQITQQAFNELLDPIFLEKENDSIDVAAHRQDLRKHTKEIDRAEAAFSATECELVKAISKCGFFRYAKCVIEIFCNDQNEITVTNDSKSHFQYLQEDRRRGEGFANLKFRLSVLFSSANTKFMEVVGKENDVSISATTLRNIWLCKSHLEQEIMNAVLRCVENPASLSFQSDAPPLPQSAQSKGLGPTPYRDLTMPQFRPNSLADLQNMPAAIEESSSTSEDYESTDDGFSVPSSLIFGEPAHTTFDRIGDQTQVNVSSKGPFYTMVVPEDMVSQQPSAPNGATGNIDSEHPVHSTPKPPIDLANVLDQISEIIDRNSTSTEIPRPSIRNYTPNPVMHLFYTTTSNGVPTLKYQTKPISYILRPFATETDQFKLVTRLVRDLAMDPGSELYIKMLATLRVIAEHDEARGGGGLINQEEFVEHMKYSSLRFLEAWMEWSTNICHGQLDFDTTPAASESG